MTSVSDALDLTDASDAAASFGTAANVAEPGVHASGAGHGSADWTKIGASIRKARRSAGLSIQELARSVGVSTSHVSQVERGLGSFSAAVLYAVASKLGLSLDSLFEPKVRSVEDVVPSSFTDDVQPAEDGADALVLRREDRPGIDLLAGPRWERLTPLAEDGIELLEVIYGPGDASSEGESFVRHSGREHGIIIDGELTVQIGFETFVLHEGDSVSFDSTTPHRFSNMSGNRVRAIWIVREGAG